MRKSNKTALCGILVGLCLALMLMTGLFPFATYVAPAICGMILWIVKYEISIKWALLSYLGVSALSFMVPDKEAALFFVLIFGYYPIIKSNIDRFFKNNIIKLIVKQIYFNIIVIIALFIASLFIPVELIIASFGGSGIGVIIFFAVTSNITFFIYDKAIISCYIFYIGKIRKKLRIH